LRFVLVALAISGIELDLDYGDGLVEVIDEGFDIVPRTGDASDSRLKTKRLGMFRIRSSDHVHIRSMQAGSRHLLT